LKDRPLFFRQSFDSVTHPWTASFDLLTSCLALRSFYRLNMFLCDIPLCLSLYLFDAPFTFIVPLARYQGCTLLLAFGNFVMRWGPVSVLGLTSPPAPPLMPSLRFGPQATYPHIAVDFPPLCLLVSSFSRGILSQGC